MWLYPQTSLLNTGNLHTHVCYLPHYLQLCPSPGTWSHFRSISAALSRSNLCCQHKLLSLTATNASNPKGIAGVRSSTIKELWRFMDWRNINWDYEYILICSFFVLQVRSCLSCSYWNGTESILAGRSKPLPEPQDPWRSVRSDRVLHLTRSK